MLIMKYIRRKGVIICSKFILGACFSSIRKENHVFFRKFHFPILIIVIAVFFTVPITTLPAYRRQYCICRFLQLHAISSHCPVASITSAVAYSDMPSPPAAQWPVSPLPLPTATCHLLPLPSGQYHLYRCLQLHAISSHCPMASVTSTVAYSYMPSPFSAYSNQYHLYCCLQLHSFSSHCPVSSITSAVAYSYMPSSFSAYSVQYHLYCCLQLHAISVLCLQWPVSPLLLPAAAFLLLPLPSVQYHLHCCLQLHAYFLPTCSHQYQFSTK
jgi:hypothetical protein